MSDNEEDKLPMTPPESLPEKKSYGSVAAAAEDKSEVTTTELITNMGFGPAQWIQCSVLWLGWFSEAAEIFIMPILSTRLYVQWQLSPSLEAAMGACSYAGFAVSYPLWGVIADRIGRKSALVLASVWVTAWGGACALAPGLYWLLAFRLMYSLAGGVVNIIFPFYYELLPPEWRWFGFVTGGLGFSVGGLYPIVLAYFLLSHAPPGGNTWRYYIAYTTIPSALFVLLLCLVVEESPRFLVSVGNPERALAVIRRMAALNRCPPLPDHITLKREEEKGAAGESRPRLTLLESMLSIARDPHLLLVILCILAFGLSTRYTIYGLAYVKTELLFLDGATRGGGGGGGGGGGDYCQGSDENTYLLHEHDYLNLIYLNLFDLLSDLLGFFYLYWKVSLKVAGLVSYGVGCLAVGGLYACPRVTLALVLVVVARTMVQGFVFNMWLSLSGLLPTNVRTSLFGLCAFLMYLILPGTPYLIQVLAKLNQHYVTSTSLGFMLMGFVAACVVPRHIYSN